jgi:hypothetical protein
VQRSGRRGGPKVIHSLCEESGRCERCEKGTLTRALRFYSAMLSPIYALAVAAIALGGSTLDCWGLPSLRT